jgi:hypothetical protein
MVFALVDGIGYDGGMETVTEQLRRAVAACGETRYAVSKATGVPSSVLSRFVVSGRGLRSENFDRLCVYLELVLVPKAGAKRRSH